MLEVVKHDLFANFGCLVYVVNATSLLGFVFLPYFGSRAVELQSVLMTKGLNLFNLKKMDVFFL